MSKLLRGKAATYEAKSLSGASVGTVPVFLVLWWLLGHSALLR